MATDIKVAKMVEFYDPYDVAPQLMRNHASVITVSVLLEFVVEKRKENSSQIFFFSLDSGRVLTFLMAQCSCQRVTALRVHNKTTRIVLFDLILVCFCLFEPRLRAAVSHC